MARPRKNTVDYFPHACTHGKTMFIIKERFRTEGYTCWFTILEELGKANNHVIDVRNPVTYEYLTSVTMVSRDILREVLNMLAKLGAIDKELWSIGAIYSQNFVDNITDAYRNREGDAPTREDVLEFLTSETKFLTSETEFLPISDVGNTQSKGDNKRVDKKKEDETPGKESPIPGKAVNPTPEQIDLDFATRFLENVRKRKPTKSIDLHKWADEFRKIRLIDSISVDDIQLAIDFLDQSEPSDKGFCWGDVVLSPAKLRKQLGGSLYPAMHKGSKRATEPDVDEYGWTRKERGLE